MRNKYIKVLVILFGIVFLLIISVVGIVFLNKSVIREYAITQINTQLLAKVNVEEIELTLFKHFPSVSLDFKTITINEPDNDKKRILQAKHLYLSFNVYDILLKRYKINKISIDSGTCNLLVNQQGKMNYNILKSDSGSGNNLIELNAIDIENLQCKYADEQSKVFLIAYISDGTISFKRNNKLNDIRCLTRIKIDKLQTGNTVIIKEKSIEADFKLLVDENQHLVQFKDANLVLDQLQLALEGNYTFGKKPYLDIKTKASNTTIQGILSLLPIPLPPQLLEYESDGDIQLSIDIKGFVSKSQTPAVNAQFTINNGTFKDIKSGTEIRELNCSGRFTNGKAKNTETMALEINPFRLQFEGGTMSGNLKIENFKNPFLTLTCDGKLPIGPLLKFQQNKYILKAEGSIETDLTIKGLISELTKVTSPSLISSGNLTIQASDLQLASSPDRTINTLQAAIKLTGNNILIENCYIRSDKSDIAIHGTVTNFYPYLFNDKKLVAKLNYQSAFMDIGHLLFFSTDKKSLDTSGFVLPNNISLELNLKVDALQFSLFQAKKMKADLHWIDNMLVLKNMECSAMEGDIKSFGQLEMSPQGKILINITSQLNHINIHELFRQCANFGQDEITYQNLDGILDGKIEMVSVWSNKLECETDKLWVGSDILITNGQLKNYKPLRALSKFAKLEDLENLKFSTLKNQIHISKRVIYIPEMYVINNALNFTLSGTHTFDNLIDYRLKIKLRELLAKKRNKEPNGYEEPDESGKGMYLYLLMKGPLTDPKIRYDRIGVTTKILQDLRNEKNNIKKLFQLERDTLIKEKSGKNNSMEELEFEKE